MSSGAAHRPRPVSPPAEDHSSAAASQGLSVHVCLRIHQTYHGKSDKENMNACLHGQNEAFWREFI